MADGARLADAATVEFGEPAGPRKSTVRLGRRRVIRFLAATGATVGMILAGPAAAEMSAAASIAECDGLAAHPNDPNKVGPGVVFDRVDGPAAIESCGRALTENPGNPHVMFTLGRANERVKRFDEAARLYKLAADQGNAAAQTNLGTLYALGSGGLTKDDREAARLYKLAADQGFASAQTDLGIFYEQGRGGFAKDDRQAARLYKLAADQGHARGQNYLAVFYRDGRGGLEKDEHEAVRLFRLAAEQGDDNAKRNLAQLGIR